MALQYFYTNDFRYSSQFLAKLSDSVLSCRTAVASSNTHVTEIDPIFEQESACFRASCGGVWDWPLAKCWWWLALFSRSGSLWLFVTLFCDFVACRRQFSQQRIQGSDQLRSSNCRCCCYWNSVFTKRTTRDRLAAACPASRAGTAATTVEVSQLIGGRTTV